MKSIAVRLLAPLSLVALLAACSDIKKRTWVMELTTDETPHLVELWRRKEEQNRDMILTYAVEFPQNYYMYEDNHRHLKQTTIGLLLDRRSLRPLTSVMVEEGGVVPETSHWPQKTYRSWIDRYRDRALFVTIEGLVGDLKMRRPLAGLNFQPEPSDTQFEWYSRPSTGDPGSGGTTFQGFSKSDPLVRVSCPKIDGICTVDTQYLRSTLHFTVPKSDVQQAPLLARRLIALLADHTRSSDRS